MYTIGKLSYVFTIHKNRYLKLKSSLYIAVTESLAIIELCAVYISDISAKYAKLMLVKQQVVWMHGEFISADFFLFEKIEFVQHFQSKFLVNLMTFLYTSKRFFEKFYVSF